MRVRDRVRERERERWDEFSDGPGKMEHNKKNTEDKPKQRIKRDRCPHKIIFFPLFSSVHLLF